MHGLRSQAIAIRAFWLWFAGLGRFAVTAAVFSRRTFWCGLLFLRRALLSWLRLRLRPWSFSRLRHALTLRLCWPRWTFSPRVLLHRPCYAWGLRRRSRLRLSLRSLLYWPCYALGLRRRLRLRLSLRSLLYWPRYTFSLRCRHSFRSATIGRTSAFRRWSSGNRS